MLRCLLVLCKARMLLGSLCSVSLDFVTICCVTNHFESAFGRCVVVDHHHLLSNTAPRVGAGIRFKLGAFPL